MGYSGQFSGEPTLPTEGWARSRACGPQGNCVEVNQGVPDLVGVRDSKRGDGTFLTFGPAQWTAFVDELRS